MSRLDRLREKYRKNPAKYRTQYILAKRKAIRTGELKGEEIYKENQFQRAVLRAKDQKAIKSLEKAQAAGKTTVSKETILKTKAGLFDRSYSSPKTQITKVSDQYGREYSGKEVGSDFIGVRSVSPREQKLKASERAGFYSIYDGFRPPKSKAQIIAEQTRARSSLGIYTPTPLTNDVKFTFKKVQKQQPEITYDNLPEFEFKGREQRVEAQIKIEDSFKQFNNYFSNLKPAGIEKTIPNYKPAKINLAGRVLGQAQLFEIVPARAIIFTEGLGTKEGRREVFIDAPKRVAPSLKSAYDIRTAEGVFNTALTFGAVKQLAVYKAAKPTPKVQEIDITYGTPRPERFTPAANKGNFGGGFDAKGAKNLGGVLGKSSNLNNLVGRGGTKQNYFTGQEAVILPAQATATRAVSITVQYPKLKPSLFPAFNTAQTQAQATSLKIGQQQQFKTKSITATKLDSKYKIASLTKQSQNLNSLTKTTTAQTQTQVQAQAQTQTQAQIQKQIQTQIQIQKQIIKQPKITTPKIPRFNFFFGKASKFSFKGFNFKPISQPRAFRPSVRASFLGLKGKTSPAAITSGIGERFILPKKKKRGFFL